MDRTSRSATSAFSSCEHMGLGRHPGLEGQFHRAEHRLFVVLQHQGEDLHHLPVATRVLQQMLLEAPEGLGQLGEGRAVAKRAGLSLDDGQVMPPVVDRPGRCTAPGF